MAGTRLISLDQLSFGPLCLSSKRRASFHRHEILAVQFRCAEMLRGPFVFLHGLIANPAGGVKRKQPPTEASTERADTGGRLAAVSRGTHPEPRREHAKEESAHVREIGNSAGLHVGYHSHIEQLD
jgi:hypothetical protein